MIACSSVTRLTGVKWLDYRRGGQLEAVVQSSLENEEEIPGGPVVRTLRFHCRGDGFDPWLGNLRSCMPVWPKKKKGR